MDKQVRVVSNIELYRALEFDIGLGLIELKSTFGPRQKYALH